MTLNNMAWKKPVFLIAATACALVCTLLLFLHLQHTQEYIYFYREQQQVFLYEGKYIRDLLQNVGGAMTVAGQWLTQFFLLPYAGAIASAKLSLFAALCLGVALRVVLPSLSPRSASAFPPLWLVPLLFLPALFTNIALTDSYAHYDALVALCTGALFWALYTLLPADRWILRTCVSSVCSLVVYYAAGSVMLPVCAAMLLTDMLRRAPKSWLTLVPLLLVLAAGFIAVNRGLLAGYDYAYTPQLYCEYYFQPTALHYLSWASFVLLAPLAWASTRLRLPAWADAVTATGLVIVLSVTATRLAAARINPVYYTLQKEIHFADTGEWDRLLAVDGINSGNLVQMNYINLALSCQGRLLTDLFAYPQQNEQSLMMPYEQFTDMGVLMSRLYYRMGNIGAAQNMAFSTTVGITYGNPSMNQMLIKTYLINGNYRIAEKHIRMMEKTHFYADWATSQRRFLYNDEAVEADAELGPLRRGLPDHDGFTMLFGTLNDLATVLRANPDYRPAADYAVALLLLSKDFNALKSFVEEFHGKGCLEVLPERLQEAILTYSENDLDYCRAHGVSEEIISRFARFRQEVLSLRRSGAANMSRLAAEWGRTFWYYMLR